MLSLLIEQVSIVELEFPANAGLPEAERVRAHIRWPTMAEDAAIPDLEFEDKPVLVPERVAGILSGRIVQAVEMGADDEGEVSVPRYQRIATAASIARLADHVLRRHVPTIEGIEGITTGADLALIPAESAAPVVWAIVLAFRAGPSAVLAKKKAS